MADVTLTGRDTTITSATPKTPQSGDTASIPVSLDVTGTLGVTDSGNTGTFDASSLTGNKTYTLPDFTGVLPVMASTATNSLFPQVLSVTAGISSTTVAVTNIYTVPAGTTAVITGAIIVSSNTLNITIGPTIGIGVAAGEDDIIASTSLTGLNAPTKIWNLTNAPGIQTAATTESVIKLGVDVVAGPGPFPSQTLTCYLLGFLI